ncbi:MAG TPA: 4-hydroxy-tetrahydrodipicolinate synthase [Polyangiaceae bacterium]|nr:4-hydroxy-tetrahydrodipicolinate synthase [Polyangiaceae bacterium]
MADLDLSGTFTALVTPLSASGSEIDFAAYEKLLALQLSGRVSGLVPCGTTGEAPTLSVAEQRELIALTVRAARGKASVIVGTGSNDTKKTIEATKAAFEAGADAAMLAMPYYNKPSQEGLLRHVTLVAQAASGPLVLYNIPGRSSVNLEVETLLRILDLCPNVLALKDASGGVLYCQELLARAKDRITVLSGDDPLTLPLMSVGARGVISVTSNVLPRTVAEVVEAALAGHYDRAREKHAALFPLHRELFSEPSPSPIKAALVQRGVIASPEVRSPLVAASPTCTRRVAEALSAFEGRA